MHSPSHHSRPLRPCKVSGCPGIRSAKGYCNKHYQRWLLHGDPLAGGKDRPANGAPLGFLERAYRHDGDDCLIWPFGKFQGYGIIAINKSTFRVPRLVCEHIHGPAPSPKYDAAHSCGNGHLGCCSPRHLSWKTRAQNVADSRMHGTIARGERAGTAKLGLDDILAIRQLAATGVSQQAIAARFSVSQSHVSGIINGKSWGHVS